MKEPILSRKSCAILNTSIDVHRIVLEKDKQDDVDKNLRTGLPQLSFIENIYGTMNNYVDTAEIELNKMCDSLHLPNK